MHELTVCSALVRQASQIAAQRRALAVKRIRVSVGALSGVDCAALLHAFPLAAAGTTCADAGLVVDTAPVRVHCPACDQSGDATPQRLACRHCGNAATTLIGGDELLLCGLELLMEDD